MYDEYKLVAAWTRFGATIAARRRERGLTQEQLADALGIDTTEVDEFERGECVLDILKVFAISIELDGSPLGACQSLWKILREEQLC